MLLIWPFWPRLKSCLRRRWRPRWQHAPSVGQALSSSPFASPCRAGAGSIRLWWLRRDFSWSEVEKATFPSGYQWSRFVGIREPLHQARVDNLNNERCHFSKCWRFFSLSVHCTFQKVCLYLTLGEQWRWRACWPFCTCVFQTSSTWSTITVSCTGSQSVYPSLGKSICATRNQTAKDPSNLGKLNFF